MPADEFQPLTARERAILAGWVAEVAQLHEDIEQWNRAYDEMTRERDELRAHAIR